MAFLGSVVTPVAPGQSGLGAYRIAAYSGLTTGVAAAAPLFSLRWTDTTNICAINYLKISMQTVTAFTAAQRLAFSAKIARSFTAADTGGSSLTLATNNCKLRTANASTLFAAASILMATTGTLTAGTRTLDSNPILTQQGSVYAAATALPDPPIQNIFDASGNNGNPIVLVANEGLVILNDVLQGAAGTVVLSVDIGWSEHAAY